MSAKFVWGVVLIVLGVVAVINGFQQIGEIAQLDQFMDDFSRIFGTYQSTNPHELSSYAQASHNAKIYGAMKIIAGIGLAFWGTWLIQDAQTPKTEKEVVPPLPRNPHDWKFMPDESQEFTRPTETIKNLAIPIYSDPNRPNISKARCNKCGKEFTYPTKRTGDTVPCPQCRIEFELP